MASTYTLISSQVLASSAATITFSSIPQTYTDLVLKISSRTDSTMLPFQNIYMRPNTNTGNNYSETVLYESSATVGTFRSSNSSLGFNLARSGAGGLQAANIFGSTEVYIPNYATTTIKQISTFIGLVENGGTNWIGTEASLFRDTSPITSLYFYDAGGDNFVSGTSFYLYGISNA